MSDFELEEQYKLKYLKYKQKYNELKLQGGAGEETKSRFSLFGSRTTSSPPPSPKASSTASPPASPTASPKGFGLLSKLSATNISSSISGVMKRNLGKQVQGCVDNKQEEIVWFAPSTDLEAAFGGRFKDASNKGKIFPDLKGKTAMKDAIKGQGYYIRNGSNVAKFIGGEDQGCGGMDDTAAMQNAAEIKKKLELIALIESVIAKLTSTNAESKNFAGMTQISIKEGITGKSKSVLDKVTKQNDEIIAKLQKQIEKIRVEITKLQPQSVAVVKGLDGKTVSGHSPDSIQIVGNVVSGLIAHKVSGPKVSVGYIVANRTTGQLVDIKLNSNEIVLGKPTGPVDLVES